MARANKLYRFIVTVQGQSDFPVDMLRYDALCPKTEANSHAIRRSLQESFQPEPLVIEVTGIHEGNWAPNTARWFSYGYTVTAVERRDEIR